MKNVEGEMCRRKGCDAPAELHRYGIFTCKKHYKFFLMRRRAKLSGLYVPTEDELEVVYDPAMICPDCSKQMNYAISDGSYSNVATLQHYRDGTIGIVCGACNTKHRYMPEDTYRCLPEGHKWCKDCETIKPHSEFWKNNCKTRDAKIHCVCKPCGRARNKMQAEKRKALAGTSPS